MHTLDQQRRLWRRATVALAVGVVAVLALPTLSWAGGGPFTDVGNSHPFVEEIAEVAGAGVARGFDDGSYRPSQPVTRQAMAAFLSRAGSSVAQVSGASQASPLTSTSFTTVRTAFVSVPGTDTTTQRVHVRGNVSIADSTPTGCNPCVMAVRVRDESGNVNGPERRFTVTTAQGEVNETLMADHVFTVPGGGRLFLVQARFYSSSAAPNLDVGNVQISGTVIPFSATPNI